MADQITPKVLRVRASPLLNSTGTVTARTSVDYMIGEHGPFTLTLTDVEFSADKVKAAMEQRAAELRKLPM